MGKKETEMRRVLLKPADGVGRDPEDNKFISCAISPGVRYIVTGDKDLSDLGHYQTVKIIKVHDFLKMFG